MAGEACSASLRRSQRPAAGRSTGALRRGARPPRAQQHPEPPAPRRLEGTPLEARLDGLALMRQEFDVGGRRLRVVCPADVDAVLDRLIESGGDGDPYWTRGAEGAGACCASARACACAHAPSQALAWHARRRLRSCICAAAGACVATRPAGGRHALSPSHTCRRPQCGPLP